MNGMTGAVGDPINRRRFQAEVIVHASRQCEGGTRNLISGPLPPRENLPHQAPPINRDHWHHATGIAGPP